MTPIPSTAEIIVSKMLSRNVDRKWVDWAYEMLVAGFENENLVILAGEGEPYNQFELARLTDKIFEELDLKYEDAALTYKNYARYLVSQALEGKVSYEYVLDILKGIYVSANYEPPYYSFYELYFAYSDLKNYGDQHYVAGATRENIQEVIKACFVKWAGG